MERAAAVKRRGTAYSLARDASVAALWKSGMVGWVWHAARILVFTSNRRPDGLSAGAVAPKSGVWCRREDLNLHGVAPTWPRNMSPELRSRSTGNLSSVRIGVDAIFSGAFGTKGRRIALKAHENQYFGTIALCTPLSDDYLCNGMRAHCTYFVPK